MNLVIILVVQFPNDATMNIYWKRRGGSDGFKVQTLGELRMRDTAKLMGWAIFTPGLPLAASVTRASYSSR